MQKEQFDSLKNNKRSNTRQIETLLLFFPLGFNEDSRILLSYLGTSNIRGGIVVTTLYLI